MGVQRSEVPSRRAVGPEITAPGAAVRIPVVTAREDIEIARQTRAVLESAAALPRR